MVRRDFNAHGRIWAGGVAYGPARQRLLLLADQERAATRSSLLEVVLNLVMLRST